MIKNEDPLFIPAHLRAPTEAELSGAASVAEGVFVGGWAGGSGVAQGIGFQPQNVQPSNPKTLMGNLKVPNLSVIPATALIRMAQAMAYGAYHSPRKDGSKGYGPFNWRDAPIEFMTYIEAAIRHLMAVADREDIDPETGEHRVMHLGLAMATIGILIDAIDHGSVIDNRPLTAKGRVAELLRELRKNP